MVALRRASNGKEYYNAVNVKRRRNGKVLKNPAARQVANLWILSSLLTGMTRDDDSDDDDEVPDVPEGPKAWRNTSCRTL